MLEGALRVRADVPFACQGGVCGTCRAKLVDGTVEMETNYALEPDEIDDGYVLTCQSHPTSPTVRRRLRRLTRRCAVVGVGRLPGVKLTACGSTST